MIGMEIRPHKMREKRWREPHGFLSYVKKKKVGKKKDSFQVTSPNDTTGEHVTRY